MYDVVCEGGVRLLMNPGAVLQGGGGDVCGVQGHADRRGSPRAAADV